MKCTIRKKTFLLAWPNRKPTEVQKFQLDDVSLRKSGINTDRTCKFMNNSNPEGLVFKIVRGFLISLFVALQFSSRVCLSKFYRFRKTEFPHSFYSLIPWESSDQISGKFVKFSCFINFFKEGTFAEKPGRVFLHPKFWRGNHMWINVSIWANAYLPLP